VEAATTTEVNVNSALCIMGNGGMISQVNAMVIVNGEVDVARTKSATTLSRNIIVITTRVNGVEVAASRRTALKHVHGVE
jgi:hypothetical protein